MRTFLLSSLFFSCALSKPGEQCVCNSLAICDECEPGLTCGGFADACQGSGCGGYCVVTCATNADCAPSCHCGFTAAEVSTVLGLTDANERVLLHRARAKVRAALEDYFEGADV